VKVGDTNEKLVQVIDGLNEGEQVALDARSRASIEFKVDENADAVAKSKTAPKAAPAPEPAPGP
jgi:hypothetical protein